MGETITDPRDMSTTTAGQGTTPPDYDPRDNSTILGTSYKRVPSTEHGAGIPMEAQTSEPDIPDYVKYSPPALNRIVDAAVEGYKNTQPILTPEAQAHPVMQGVLGTQVYNPVLHAVGAALGVLNGAGAAQGQAAYEAGNLYSPKLGRDLYMANQVASPLLLASGGGFRDPVAPKPEFAQGSPRSVMERMAPPPIEGQTTLGRAIDLLRHDQLWNDPNTPGYHPPGFDPNQAFTPPGVVPPPSGPPMSGVPDTFLTRALGPDPNAPVTDRPVVSPPPSSPPGTPSTAAGAKQIASLYYAVADKNGGTLTPQFTNRWLDTIAKSAEQSDWGKAAAGSNPVVDLIGRLQGQRDQPMSLAAMQEVDQAIGKQISRQYGPGGSMQDAADLLDVQHKLRDQIDAAGPGDVTGGSDGFDALAPARKAWSQAAKMDDLERMRERADQTANPTTSFKAQVTNYRLNRAKSRGWADDEIDALKDSANRGVIGGGLHLLGSRLLPLVTAGVGGTGGNIGGGIAGWATGQVLGAGVRALGNRMAAARVANALDVLNRGVPPPPPQ